MQANALLTRRALLKSGACALAAVTAPPRFLARAAAAADGRGKVLVAIFQRAAGALLPARATPFRAVAVGPRLPRSLRGDAGALALSSLERFDVRAGGETSRARRGFESLYDDGVHDLLHGAGRETFEAVKLLKSAGAAQLAPANGADYPRGRFGEALRQVA